MDDCTNCHYKEYCKRRFKFFNINPCNIVLPDQKDILKQIDDITEDLNAQYL